MEGDHFFAENIPQDFEGGAAAAPSATAHLDSLSPTAVCNFWKEFDLEGLRSTLDEHGLAIAGHQESSVATRKQLAERTKEFRRGLSPEAFKQLGPLLKMYQEEVDRLTGRAKAGESAFLDVFKRLYEAPDPAPALAAGLELASRAAELEAAASKAARELAEFKEESKALKNQDLTIRRLEERVRALEAEVAERAAEAEEARRSAAAQLEARSAEESRAREARLAEELARAQTGMDALRRMHQATQAQLFSVQERGEEAAAAARAEAEFATAEVERAQQQLATLERERNALMQRLQRGDQAPGTAAAAAAPPAEVAALRDELRAQRELASRLQSEVAAAAQRAGADTAASSTRLASLQAALAAKEAHCAALEAELAGRPTQRELDEARQQARVLRAVVHNTLDEDEGGDEGGGGEGGRGALEAALLGKNRHLEHRLTMARLEVAAARGEAEAASARASELEAELERARSLVARLEEDLLAADNAPDNGGGGDAGDAGPGGDAAPLRRPSSAGGGGGEQTMVSVLVAQRDRFKARVQELEGEAAAAASRLTKAMAEVEAARADNVALVERLRFVQGYAANSNTAAGTPGGGGAGRRSSTPSGEPADVEAGTGVVGKYMREYEDRVNPFTDFRAREREARRRQMPLQDRAAFAVGSALVSGSRVARSVILIYALALHCVAFLVLAGFSRRQEGKIERLEEMCATLGGASGSVLGGTQAAGIDPVVGGAVAAVAQGAGRALRRLLFQA